MQDIPGCLDTDPKTSGSQPFECPDGMQLNRESTSTQPSVEACCLVGSGSTASRHTMPWVYSSAAASILPHTAETLWLAMTCTVGALVDAITSSVVWSFSAMHI
jgi:hypothetical protein